MVEKENVHFEEQEAQKIAEREARKKWKAAGAERNRYSRKCSKLVWEVVFETPLVEYLPGEKKPIQKTKGICKSGYLQGFHNDI